MIRNRTQAVTERPIFNYWSADLMIMRKKYEPANIATLVVRVACHTVSSHNNDCHSNSIMSALMNNLAPPP